MQTWCGLLFRFHPVRSVALVEEAGVLSAIPVAVVYLEIAVLFQAPTTSGVDVLPGIAPVFNSRLVSIID